MKNFKRLLSTLIAFMAITMLNPTGASANWKQDSNNHWNYADSNDTNFRGWHQVDGHWYYFADNEVMQTGWLNSGGNWYYLYGDGTMAHDTTIDGSYLNSAGAWTTSIPVTPTTTSYNNGNSGSSNSSGDVQYVDSNGNGLIKGSKTHIYHTPGSTYYNKTTNVAQWFKTVKEAEAAGYRAPER